MDDNSFVSRIGRQLKERFLRQEVTVYPSYGYRDPADPEMWTVPMRVWVHDNRDFPGAEELIERIAVRFFEDDLQGVLEPSEKARLERCLAHFIADDKSDESVAIRFADDPNERVFELTQRTTANGVIEESLSIPNQFVRELYAPRGGEERWLTIEARTADGNGSGTGRIRFLETEGLSVVSDIDDTIKITQVPAGKRTILRNTFLREFRAAPGMRDRYVDMIAQHGAAADVCFHYVSGSPWQLYALLSEFLIAQEQFPAGTFHMKNLRKNLFESGALESIRAFVLGGDLSTLDQKVRQITNLMIHLPRRKFILIGDSGEKDPEVYRAIQKLFPNQVQQILIRDVLGERLAGMERISGPDVSVWLDTSELEKEMMALIDQTRAAGGETPKL